MKLYGCFCFGMLAASAPGSSVGFVSGFGGFMSHFFGDCGRFYNLLDCLGFRAGFGDRLSCACASATSASGLTTLICVLFGNFSGHFNENGSFLHVLVHESFLDNLDYGMLLSASAATGEPGTFTPP